MGPSWRRGLRNLSTNKAGPQGVGAKVRKKPGEDVIIGRRWLTWNPGGKLEVGNGRLVGPFMGEEMD